MSRKRRWMCIALPGPACERLGDEGRGDPWWRSELPSALRRRRGKLVGEVKRRRGQVDLHPRRAGLMDQRIDVEVLRLAESIDVVEQWIDSSTAATL